MLSNYSSYTILKDVNPAIVDVNDNMYVNDNVTESRLFSFDSHRVFASGLNT